MSIPRKSTASLRQNGPRVLCSCVARQPQLELERFIYHTFNLHLQLFVYLKGGISPRRVVEQKKMRYGGGAMRLHGKAITVKTSFVTCLPP